MKIRIEDKTLTGTPEEILHTFRDANFHADRFKNLDDYIEYMRKYCERITERPCPLPESGTRSERAAALIRRLAEIGAVRIWENEDGR